MDYSKFDGNLGSENHIINQSELLSDFSFGEDFMIDDSDLQELQDMKNSSSVALWSLICEFVNSSNSSDAGITRLGTLLTMSRWVGINHGAFISVLLLYKDKIINSQMLNDLCMQYIDLSKVVENVGDIVRERYFNIWQERSDKDSWIRNLEVDMMNRSLQMFEYKHDENISEDVIVERLQNSMKETMIVNSILTSVKEDIKNTKLSFEDIDGISVQVSTVKEFTKNGELMRYALFGKGLKNIVEDLYDSEDYFFQDIYGIGTQKKYNDYMEDVALIEQNMDVERDVRNREDLIEMIKMYYENYKDDPEFQKLLVKNFIKLCISGADTTNLYLYRHAGQLMSFCRVDKLDIDNHFIIGAINVIPFAHGQACGSAFLNYIMDDLYADAYLKLTSSPEQPSSVMYVEQYNFRIESIETSIRNFGSVFKCFRSPIDVNVDKSLFQTQKELIEMAQTIPDFLKQDFVLTVPKKSINDLVKIINEATKNHGFVVSRYFFHKAEDEEYWIYAKFEKK